MKIVNIRLEPDVKDRLQKIAAEDKRTLSNLIQKIIDDYLKEREGSPKK